MIGNSIKYISDPLYGFVELDTNLKNGLLLKVIDTNEFQRLRFVVQTGLSFFAYPTAHHNRFEHSLGVYYLAKEFLTRFSDVLIDKEYKENFLIAALLHDIGHAAFSHDYEYMVNKIIEHETNNKNNVPTHEKWLIKIIASPETNINKTLFKEASIGETILEILSELYKVSEENKSISKEGQSSLTKMLSSELDIDRLDYLLRDSYFTGVASGVYDFERLKRSLIYNVKKGTFIVREKDIPAVEGFFIARYHMYRLVYHHKTTLSAKSLFTKIFLRAWYLYQKKNLNKNEVFNPIESLLGNGFEPPIKDYLEIIDPLIILQIRKWSKSDDDILKELSKRFLSRKLFKPIPIKEHNIKSFSKQIETIKSLVSKHGYDPTYYLDIVEVPDIEWRSSSGVKVMETDKDIFEASSIIQSILKSKSTIKGYIMVPTDDIRKIAYKKIYGWNQDFL